MVWGWSLAKWLPRKFHPHGSWQHNFLIVSIHMPIKTRCEIEINITIHTLVLLSIWQNTYYRMIFIATFHFSVSAVATMLISSFMIFVRFLLSRQCFWRSTMIHVHLLSFSFKTTHARIWTWSYYWLRFSQWKQQRIGDRYQHHSWVWNTRLRMWWWLNSTQCRWKKRRNHRNSDFVIIA